MNEQTKRWIIAAAVVVVILLALAAYAYYTGALDSELPAA